jgi:hypothetical protein
MRAGAQRGVTRPRPGQIDYRSCRVLRINAVSCRSRTKHWDHTKQHNQVLLVMGINMIIRLAISWKEIRMKDTWRRNKGTNCLCSDSVARKLGFNWKSHTADDLEIVKVLSPAMGCKMGLEMQNAVWQHNKSIACKYFCVSECRYM